MHICYIDEAGCTGMLPGPRSEVQPALVVCGVAFRQEVIADLTREFVVLKQRYFPNLKPANRRALHWILSEVKGCEIRKQACSDSRKKRRHAIGFLDKFVEIQERYEARIFGRVWVKTIGAPIDGIAVYTSSVQYICSWFHKLLEARGTPGIVISDSRTKALNSSVAHSIFTQKFCRDGDQYPRIYEMPTFGHSENHAGVQIADLLCSALLYPMAIETYCRGYVRSKQVRKGYDQLVARFGQRIKALQHRGWDQTSIPPRMRGGITTWDGLGGQRGSLLFGTATGASSRPRVTAPATTPASIEIQGMRGANIEVTTTPPPAHPGSKERTP